MFLTTLSLAVVLGLFLNMNYVQSKTKPETFNRVFKESTLKFIQSFKVSGRIGELKYYQGRLYLQDFHTRKILELDTLGNVLNRYGETIDPETQSAIISWGVDDKGLYLADAKRHNITYLGFNNSVTYQYDPGLQVLHAERLKPDQFIVNTLDESDYRKFSFVLIDTKNGSKEYLNYPLPDINESRMKQDGFYVKNESGQVFYICYMAGLFFSIDSDGNLLYSKETVDKSPYPKLLVNGESRRFDPLSPNVNLSGGANENFLYILSGEHNQSGVSVVDAYNVENGEYQWSFRVPNFSGSKAVRLTVAPEGFYFLQGNNITYYQNVKDGHYQ